MPGVHPSESVHLLVNVGPDFVQNRLLALEEVPRVRHVEEVHLHLRFDGRLAPHFERLATLLQLQLLRQRGEIITLP